MIPLDEVSRERSAEFVFPAVADRYIVIVTFVSLPVTEDVLKVSATWREREASFSVERGQSLGA